MAIYGIYVPNDSDTEMEKETFYNKLQEMVDDIGGNRNIIMIGDFNGRTGFRKKNVIVSNFGEKTRNDNGDRLLDFY